MYNLLHVLCFILSLPSLFPIPSHLPSPSPPPPLRLPIPSPEMDLNPNTMRFLYLSAAIVILFSIIRLCAEAFQLIQLKLRYFFDWVNWIECLLFSLAIIFAWVFNTQCLCPLRWQWQIGAIAVFLAWIDLIIIFRKLPLTGIFVVMFLDIFYTFLKMIILSFLLVIAFSLSFYMAFFVPGAQFEVSEHPFQECMMTSLSPPQ